MSWFRQVLAGATVLPTQPDLLGYESKQSMRMALEHMASTLLEVIGTWAAQLRISIRDRIAIPRLVTTLAGFGTLVPAIEGFVEVRTSNYNFKIQSQIV